MDGFRRTAMVLLMLLPIAFLAGCGGGDEGGNSGSIAFQSGDPASPTVFTINGDGTNQQMVVADAKDPALSPNGQTIAFARGADIYLINKNGTGETNLTNNGIGVQASDPTFNPQGTKIAYDLAPTGDTLENIHLMNVDGSDDVVLVTDGDDSTFTPSGNQVVFTRGTDLWQINADGTGLTQLTHHPAGASADDPAVDALGNTVLFTYRPTAMSTPSIRRLNLSTGEETTVVTDASDPSFSPDDSSFAFVRNGTIVAANSLSLAETPLTAGPTDTSPSWSVLPD